MMELISTITNLAFIIVGVLICLRSWYVGIITIILGIASMGWHWVMQPFWRSFDVVMMYFMLIALVDYITGSRYTILAFIAGMGAIGVHFFLPSHVNISLLAFIILVVLIRNYQPWEVIIIFSWFALWIFTNIPYLQKWDLPFWVLDVLHGISHIFASVGIYTTVFYRHGKGL